MDYRPLLLLGLFLFSLGCIEQKFNCGEEVEKVLPNNFTLLRDCSNLNIYSVSDLSSNNQIILKCLNYESYQDKIFFK